MAIHRERFLYVPHVGHDSALIAWGAFYLERKESKDHDPPGSFRFKLLDDEKLKEPGRIPDGIRTRGSIGRNTSTFGSTEVIVKDSQGNVVATKTVPAEPYALISGLKPNTHYSYEVKVLGVDWANNTSTILMKDENDGLAKPDPVGRSHSFTTFPAPDEPSGSFTFAVIGDPGTGTNDQIEVGEALAKLIDSEGIRFVLTMGDNIYMKPRAGGLLGTIERGLRTITGRTRMSGDEDDDWFGSYFLPYRNVISRVPVFPCLGNHDSDNTEDDDDLAQLVDNLFLEERFSQYAKEWRLDNTNADTLFYRFRFGKDVEFVAVDTSFTDRQDGAEVIFELTRGERRPPLGSEQHRKFIDEVLAEKAPRWRIPFGHHPPYSLGPSHSDNPVVQALAQRFAKASPDRPLIWLAGHEHNFQHHREGQVHYLMSGAAGKCNKLKNVEHPPPHACCHTSVCHFLLVTVTDSTVRARLIDQKGHEATLSSWTAASPHKETEIVV